ncbi:hypothetical protein AXG93_2402s1270 [Marchantia polymorpha subsp. ruderalis]|uniref:Uncharacterized protein n=1 Tax=Marchantia polymorpha subsp. ruderalis TaxID=1480154 RepID=A0A176VTA8_MARPO|nr:hypothetical protein AXG93_2402s1270 [Marchantia polymorpha subsp. ruderalis]
MAGRLEGRQAGSGARAARDGHAADALPSARTGRFGGEPGGGTCARLSSAYTNNAAPSTAIAGRAGRAFLLDRGLRVAALHALDPARIAGQRAGFQISCGVEAGDVVKAQVPTSANTSRILASSLSNAPSSGAEEAQVSSGLD